MFEAWRFGPLPHDDAAPYLDASPVLMSTSFGAPLLLVHGDLDFIPFQQAEEMFSSLRAAGRPAELVRYWGEDHVLSSPANIRDFCARIVDWLDRHGGNLPTGGRCRLSAA